MQKEKKKTIIYLVGESAQGKTTLAFKLRDILGACVLHSDEANLQSKPTYEKEKKINAYKKMYKEKNILILEGGGFGNANERRLCKEAIGIKDYQEYMLKIDVPGLKERQDEKWRGELERTYIDKIDKDFMGNFEPIPNTYIIDNFDYCEEMFKEHKLKAFNYFKKYDIPNNK